MAPSVGDCSKRALGGKDVGVVSGSLEFQLMKLTTDKYSDFLFTDGCYRGLLLLRLVLFRSYFPCIYAMHRDLAVFSVRVVRLNSFHLIRHAF